MKLNVRHIILLMKIIVKRKNLYAKAHSFGLKDPRVVTCSQDLDELLNRYQGLV